MLRRLTLPDGLEVFSLNADETRFVHLEVFVARCYLQHGMVLQDGDCVFDVGANIGLATVFFHRERRNVRIFAFEPSPAACECLRGNIEIHGADAAPVASLSGRYSVLGLRGWNPRFYPVIQMYAAFTPYLDGLNAAWMRDHGPPFLIYNGFVLDGRDAWAANPATWLEIYRWYDTRWLGPRNLLLQRRAGPRFTALEPVGRFTVRAPLSLSLPHSTVPVFWSLHCGNSLAGKVRKLLFRVAETEMIVEPEGGAARLAQIIPEMLVTPVMGTYLPDTLAEFAAVFQPNGTIPAVRKIYFGGPGIDNYTSVCEADLWRPR